MITQFESHEQLMKTWMEAKAAIKSAEEQEKACKAAAIEMNIPSDTPLYEGYGVVVKTRQSYEVPLGLVESVVGAEDSKMFTEVKKTAFDKFLDGQVEQGLMSPEDVQAIKQQYVVKSATEYLEVKKLQ